MKKTSTTAHRNGARPGRGIVNMLKQLYGLQQFLADCVVGIKQDDVAALLLFTAHGHP